MRNKTRVWLPAIGAQCLPLRNIKGPNHDDLRVRTNRTGISVRRTLPAESLPSLATAVERPMSLPGIGEPDPQGLFLVDGLELLPHEPDALFDLRQ